MSAEFVDEADDKDSRCAARRSGEKAGGRGGECLNVYKIEEWGVEGVVF